MLVHLVSLKEVPCTAAVCIAWVCCMTHMCGIVKIVVVFQKHCLSTHYSNMRLWFLPGMPLTMIA